MGEVPVHQKFEDFSGGNVVKNRHRFTHAPWASKDKFINSSEESPGARLICILYIVYLFIFLYIYFFWSHRPLHICAAALLSFRCKTKIIIIIIIIIICS